MIGTFEKFEVTHGSFGQQYTTIDGQVGSRRDREIWSEFSGHAA